MQNPDWSRDNSVCIVTRLRAGQQRNLGSILGGAKKTFLSCVQTDSVTHAIGALPARKTRVGRETEHAASFSSEFENEWSSTSTL
jgi:hypothetical protein